MSPQEPVSRSTLLGNYTILGSKVRVTKKKYKKQTPALPGLRLRNGLLNAAVPARSELMQIAQRNSVESPLLRLPPEIRNKIWKYAMGYNQVDISERSSKRSWPIGRAVDVHPLHTMNHRPSVLCPRPLLPRTFIRPTFALPEVCRQMYVESSSFIYTLNNFGFDSQKTFDRWIKNRALGQKYLVASVDMPYEYTHLYWKGFRRSFRQKFPNIKRIGVASMVPVFSRQRLSESINCAKIRIVGLIKAKEGEDVEVAWHEGTSGSVVYC